MSRSNSVDAAAHRASSEYYLLNDLAIRLCDDQTEYYLAKFNEHFTYMRNAETLTNIRNAHHKFITEIQTDLREIVKELPRGVTLSIDDTDPLTPVTIHHEKAVNFKIV
tara:strand:- start:1985 stop:2311 length:327 start_codon:yes stop_codon:yes gene_type:complete